MRFLREDSGQEIFFLSDPLVRGGEGKIYAVSGDASLVAKVYHQPTLELALKLQAMLANPPQDPAAGQNWVSIAWPRTRLLDNSGICAGYLMPRIEKARNIYDVINPGLRLKICPQFHFGYLLRTARNLAAAVRALHERGYVIGDLSGSNFLVTPRALVSLVDTDSFQVPANGTTFRCRVGTLEFTPPELQGACFTEVDRSPDQDSFGLAVLIFQLLMQGVHPFAGRYTGTGEPESVGRRIREGHWPYARTRPVPYEPNPHAPSWQVLPAPVQDLLQLCFDRGFLNPGMRPDAAAWQRGLMQAEGMLRQCGSNSQHLYSEILGPNCPWCHLARKRGLDLFPGMKGAAGLSLEETSPSLPPLEASPGKAPPGVTFPSLEEIVSLLKEKVRRWVRTEGRGGRGGEGEGSDGGGSKGREVVRLHTRPATSRQLPCGQRLLQHLWRCLCFSHTARDPVNCTVFAPPFVPQGENALVQVFAHLPKQAEITEQYAKKFDATAHPRGFKNLEAEIERGSILTFHFAMPGAEIDDPVQHLIWQGVPASVQFGVHIPREREPGTLLGTVTISQDRVPWGHIKFKLVVTTTGQGQGETEPKPVGEAAHFYRKAFISYASEDRPEVIKRVQMLPRLGIRFFQDVLDLEPADHWAELLYRHIDESDLFLLFWSTAARNSEWVHKELCYALQRKGGDDRAPPEI